MPVEIRELQIITVVKEQDSPVSATGVKTVTESDKIIAACVEQVLEILKQKTER